MELNLKIKNIEDIEYIKSINSDKDILNTALTIGLKAIQMSQTTMTGNSYIEPLKQIIVENSIENHENISKINDMLCDLLNIKNNSSRKGKLGESLAMNSLKKKYPDWKIENTTGTAHESDIFAYSENYGKILYEIKTYSSNVPSKEIQKFKDDMVTTNSKYGIFVSQTSGIVGKKLIDFETINNTIIVYVSCSGLNGHGIELATEFLLSLIDCGYLEQRYLLQNKNITDILFKINEKLHDLKDNINNFSRIKMQINEFKNTMNSHIDILYKNALEYETKGNMVLDDILNIIKIQKPYDISLVRDVEKVENYLKNIGSLNQNNLRALQNKENVELCLHEDILFLIKNDKNICKIIVQNNKLDLYFTIDDLENINLNMKYENIVNDQIHIVIPDNVYDDVLWDIIDKRI